MKEPIVEVTTSVIKNQIGTVTARLSGELKTFWLKHISSFEEYIRNANKRYESTKTLLYKEQAVPLRDIYVGTNITRSGEEVSEVEFVHQLSHGSRCVITATAGAGKSVFSKSVFLRMLSGQVSLPLFVELRNINETDSGFIDYLLNDLKATIKYR